MIDNFLPIPNIDCPLFFYHMVLQLVFSYYKAIQNSYDNKGPWHMQDKGPALRCFSCCNLKH